MTFSDIPSVPVGPFAVADLTRHDLVRTIVARGSGADQPVVAYALHVGGLNARRDPEFVGSMERADVIYADGGSVVLAARAAGARSIERAPTTDIGWDLLHELRATRGRRPTVALIGGPEGLAERAAAALEAGADVSVVLTAHGYVEDWEPIVEKVRKVSPDMLVVGLGAPREMLWVDRWRAQLPPSIVLTCGGWFGYLAGEEQRAPRLLRRAGLEWIARLAQAPTRLGPRYVRGLWSTLVVTVDARRKRRSR
ncbi:WecB/TagA/CpsF family glycosyltransferase [Mumia quercus]|uniref:WecB/TagA/CpsF family glycosyltransferase n=1 Tax=Mumia quercus TaxID=2976125 RepID=UPI0021CF8A7C|nr:WecB/TagA/CpsF family glycosyltransferase [Mumia quercus]